MMTFEHTGRFSIGQLMTMKQVFLMWKSNFELCFRSTGIAPFKGHVAWRQHIKSKSHATGLKYFAMADDCGFIIDFFMFVDF